MAGLFGPFVMVISRFIFITEISPNWRGMTLFPAILGFSLSYLSENIQLYLNSIKVPIIFFGVIYASGSIIESIGSISANKIKRNFNYRIIFTFTLSIAIAGIIGLSFTNNFYGIIAFIIILIPFLIMPYTLLLNQISFNLGYLEGQGSLEIGNNLIMYFGMIGVYDFILIITCLILGFVFVFKQKKIKPTILSTMAFILGLIYILVTAIEIITAINI